MTGLGVFCSLKWTLLKQNYKHYIFQTHQTKVFFLRNTTFLFPFFKQQLFSTCFFLILTTELHRQTQILTQPHHR